LFLSSYFVGNMMIIISMTSWESFIRFSVTKHFLEITKILKFILLFFFISSLLFFQCPFRIY
jgi:hypothetical protein